MRKPLLILGSTLFVVVLVTAAVVVGSRWWSDATRTDLQRAIDLAPGDAQRFSWTDWAAVRDQLGLSDVASPGPADLRDFLDRGYDADLTSTSSLVDSAESLQRRYGFSPATVEWELFAQSTTGSVALLKLADQASFDALSGTLVELGYTRPGSRGGVWVGGADLVAGIGGVSPQLQYLALDEDEQLVRASDSAEYLAEALAARDGTLQAVGSGVSSADRSPRSGADDEGLDAVVEASSEPVSAAVYTGTQACSSLAMGQADVTDQELADQLLAEAGEVDPLTGFAMSVQPGGGIRVALAFESEDQARTNADTRAVLARGAGSRAGGRLRRPVRGRGGLRAGTGGHPGAGPGPRCLRPLGPLHRTVALRHLLSRGARRGRGRLRTGRLRRRRPATRRARGSRRSARRRGARRTHWPR